MSRPSIAQDTSRAVGEFSFAVGPSLPRAGFLLDDDPGLNVGLKLNGRVRRFLPLSVRIDLNGNFFPSDKFLISVDDGGYTYLGVEKVSKYYLSGHLGVQLGCQDRTKFFRPHVSLSPGVYLALNSNQISVKDTGRELFREDRLQVRFGAMAVIGADFYPSPKWGFTLALVQDLALNINKPLRYDATRGYISESTTGRFYSLMIGLVIPFETLRKSSGD